MNLKEAINTFNGVMDKDSSDKDIQSGNYREMINGDNGYTNTEQNKNVINERSNLLVLNPFLTSDVDKKVMGTCEDKKGESLIYHVAESGGAHGIYRWYLNNPGSNSGKIEKVFKINNPTLYSKELPNPFNFSFDSRYAITGNVLLNNLYMWTDYLNSPRCIDVVRANETGKKRRFNIAFNRTNFGLSCEYILSLFAQGNPSSVFSLTWTSAGVTYSDRVNDFVNAVNSSPIACNHIKVINNYDSVIVELANIGQYTLNIKEAISAVAAENQSLCIPENFYPDFDAALPSAAGGYPKVSYDLFSDDFVELVKYVPLCSPSVTSGVDISRSDVSLITNKTFQFCVRYRYINNEKSCLGPYSNIPVYKIDINGSQIPTADNYIDINFSDPRLENKGLVSMITKVDICVREHNEGDWKVIQTLNQHEFAGKGLQQTYRFYNSESVIEVIPDIDEAEQVDSVPLLAKSMELADNLLFIGGNIEGYDKVPINANIEIDYKENAIGGSNLFSICGIIVIRNVSETGTYSKHNQPIFDDNVMPGYGGFQDSSDISVRETKTQSFVDPTYIRAFVPYLAGLNKYAISIQNGVLENGFPIPGVSLNPGDNSAYATSKSYRLQVSDKCEYPDNVRMNPYGLNATAPFGADGNGIALTSTANGSVPIGDDQSIGRGVWFSRFEIRGVTTGKYILRVASPIETTRAMINDGTLGYQSTSASLFMTGGQQGFEVMVTVSDADACINPKTGRKTVFIGKTEVADLTTNGSPNRQIVGYLTDQYSTLGVTNFSEGIVRPRINYAKVLANSEPSTPAGVYAKYTALAGLTDHNGYFYRMTNLAVSFGLDSISPVQVGTYAPLSPAMLLYDSDSNVFSNTTTNVLISATIPQYTQISNDRRTHIHGLVNGNGAPISGVNVVPLKCQWGTTIKGVYDIVTYAETPNDTKAVTVLFQSSIQGLIIVSGGNSYITSTPITIPVSSVGYNDIDVYTLNAIDFTVLSTRVSLSAWKPGSDEQFGLVYYDRAGRRCGVITNSKLKKHILFTNEKDDAGLAKGVLPRSLSWQIYHEPPSWAYSYQWVKTVNLQHGLYLWWAINRVIYVDDVDDEVGYTAPSATFGKINFDNTSYYVINKYPGAQINFGFQVGDRIRIITGDEYHEAEIVKIVGSYFYIRKSNEYQFKDSDFVEIYHPRDKSDTNNYYEFSECYQIKWGTFNGVCKKYHAGQLQDQSFGPLSSVPIPATGEFQSGNSWYRLRNLPTSVFAATDTEAAIPGGTLTQYVFDGSISDFYVSNDDNIGRVNSSDLMGRIEKPTTIRFSDHYLYGSKINGINKFRALNSKTYSYDYGLMTKIILVKDTVMYMLFNNSYTISAYIGKAVLRDLANASIVAISDDVISQSIKMQSTYGTQDPASVCLNDNGDLMAYDQAQSTAWRASGNGIIDISEDLMKGWFNNASAHRNQRVAKNNCIAVYDINRDRYILSMPAIPQAVAVNPKLTMCLPDFIGDTIVTAYSSLQPATPIFSINMAFGVWGGDTNAAVGAFLEGRGYIVTQQPCGCMEVEAPSSSYKGSSLTIKAEIYNLIVSTSYGLYGAKNGWVNGTGWTISGTDWRFGNVVGGITSNLYLVIGLMKPNSDYVLTFDITQAATYPPSNFTLGISISGAGIYLGTVTTQVVTLAFNSGTNPNKKLEFLGFVTGTTPEYFTLSNIKLTPVGTALTSFGYTFDNGSVADTESSPAYTLAFQKRSAQIPVQGWKSFYEYFPEYFGKVRGSVILFLNGELYLQGAGIGYNNFFGVQHARIIKYVVNNDVGPTKGFKALATFSRNAQSVPSIEIDGNSEYPNGMMSRLVTDNFEVKNGEFYSETLRDQTDPTFTDPIEALMNGRPLQGETTTITIKDESIEESPLKYCKTTYFYISKY